jgi:DNA-binding transcriptional MerR regulator
MDERPLATLCITGQRRVCKGEHVSLRHLSNLRIGDAKALYGLSARAIRFYEEKGLISAIRDRSNARLFDAEARSRLQWIARLRRAGVSLTAIQAFLDADQRDSAREHIFQCLRERRAQLLAQLEAVETLQATLEGSSRASCANSLGS